MPKRKPKPKEAYVVLAGHEIGIFKTWKEVEPLVKGYSNARYKGYSTLKDATEAYAVGYGKLEKTSGSVKVQSSNSPYTIQGTSAAILFLQSILNNLPEDEWARHFSQNEIKFVYNMVNRANCSSEFTPTEKQSRWIIEIIGKYKLILKAQEPRKPV